MSLKKHYQRVGFEGDRQKLLLREKPGPLAKEGKSKRED